MKIIIAPSKTQDFTHITSHNLSEPIFKDKADNLVKEIKKLTKEEMAKKFKVKGKLLEQTYESYHNYEQAEAGAAILSYIGEVFKQLDIDCYTKEDFVFLQQHLFILSALYGALRPSDRIKPYRLDMKINILNDESLYSYWQDDVTRIFEGEELIVNLASNEFSKIVKKPMTTIVFKEKSSDGKYKTIGTYAKKARGRMLDYIIKNRVEDIPSLKEFNVDGYVLNEGLSKKDTLVFTR
ncbi:YaaA family protein [Wukongibacter baidiensis]|uniref:YaaA family protein n=1 Tax=Wukongibacter baidiensis TaxID=1723361 RepID=UPI003D7F68CA